MNLRALVAEFLGTSALLLAIVGSGITSATDGAASSQLFQHAAAVGAALFALILTLGPISGAHFNPAVTLADVWFGGMTRRVGLAYIAAQLVGAFAGTVAANLLFGLGAVQVSTTARAGFWIGASETVATFGLLLVIFGVVRSGRINAVPAAVGAWIAAAIYFTSSASFANPAVTVARSLTDTYTGIAPADVPLFLAAQFVGLFVAIPLISWLFDPGTTAAANVVVPHEGASQPADHGERS